MRACFSKIFISCNFDGPRGHQNYLRHGMESSHVYIYIHSQFLLCMPYSKSSLKLKLYAGICVFIVFVVY